VRRILVTQRGQGWRATGHEQRVHAMVRQVRANAVTGERGHMVQVEEA